MLLRSKTLQVIACPFFLYNSRCTTKLGFLLQNQVIFDGISLHRQTIMSKNVGFHPSFSLTSSSSVATRDNPNKFRLSSHCSVGSHLRIVQESLGSPFGLSWVAWQLTKKLFPECLSYPVNRRGKLSDHFCKSLKKR